MRFAAEHRLRLNVVVAGSGEHDEYLDQLEAVDRDHGIKGRHWIMQHAFFVDERQARRYAALGIDVTTSMSFSWGKGDMFIERMGEHVLKDLILLPHARRRLSSPAAATGDRRTSSSTSHSGRPTSSAAAGGGTTARRRR